MPIATVNPATGETIRTFAELTDEELDARLARRDGNRRLPALPGWSHVVLGRYERWRDEGSLQEPFRQRNYALGTRLGEERSSPRAPRRAEVGPPTVAGTRGPERGRLRQNYRRGREGTQRTGFTS